MEKSEEIREFVQKMYDKMSTGDSSFGLNVFSKQSGVTAIGSDPKEWWVGYDKIAHIFEKQFEEMKGMQIAKSNPQAYSKGGVGWYTDQVTFKFGEIEVPMRLTGVFEKESAD